MCTQLGPEVGSQRFTCIHLVLHRPGKLPPGYDENKIRPASVTEQAATDEMQGKSEKMGHLGRDPRKDTGGPSPDYGKNDPQK